MVSALIQEEGAQASAGKDRYRGGRTSNREEERRESIVKKEEEIGDLEGRRRERQSFAGKKQARTAVISRKRDTFFSGGMPMVGGRERA